MNLKPSILKMIQVSVIFRSSRTDEISALYNLDLEINKNEFVCIVGPSGCGKTTLLRIAGGLIPPTSGEILFSDGEYTGSSLERGMAYVFQDPVLLPWRTVISNAVLPAEIRRNKLFHEAARFWLSKLGLEEFLYSYPRELSGGMRSRVALARALAVSPKVLLMDEPFAALDETTRYELDQELETLWRTQGATIILVTHSIREAVLLADRIIVMTQRPGKVKQIIEVNLDRPRDEKMLSSETGLRLIKNVRSLISGISNGVEITSSPNCRNDLK